MGYSYTASCRECGAEFIAREGGGFFFHLLHCDHCGHEKAVSFQELGKIHLKYIKGLDVPYCSVSADFDSWVQENYPGAPITRGEYHLAIEELAGKCACGGQYRMAGKPRCPRCHSTDIATGDSVAYYD